MNYLLLLLPLPLFVASYCYRVKYQRMLGSGKIPVIINAKRKTAMFLMLGLTSLCLMLMMMASFWTVQA